ncbi:hypothetical protein PR048_033554 [Dryococelus australis]|uniref:Uncharacterized protein n=1 Tax=Dryococelus australis TaxID=614101 RepID=A0ABQ9G0M1_9NEOP|nr:hypothetical protein PR048_033554 [Dryococelus australis]
MRHLTPVQVSPLAFARSCAVSASGRRHNHPSYPSVARPSGGRVIFGESQGNFSFSIRRELIASQGEPLNSYVERNLHKGTCIAAERDWAAMASDWGHDYLPKSSTFEINLRKKSLPLPAYILTGALSDMRPVRLVTMDGKKFRILTFRTGGSWSAFVADSRLPLYVKEDTKTNAMRKVAALISVCGHPLALPILRMRAFKLRTSLRTSPEEKRSNGTDVAAHGVAGRRSGTFVRDCTVSGVFDRSFRTFQCFASFCSQPSDPPSVCATFESALSSNATRFFSWDELSRYFQTPVTICDNFYYDENLSMACDIHEYSDCNDARRVLKTTSPHETLLKLPINLAAEQRCLLEQRVCSRVINGYEAIIQWLDYTPPALANRVRFPAGVAHGFSHARTLVARVFLGDLPIPTAPPHSGAAPYPPRFAIMGSQDLDCDALGCVQLYSLFHNYMTIRRRWTPSEMVLLSSLSLEITFSDLANADADNCATQGFRATPSTPTRCDGICFVLIGYRSSKRIALLWKQLNSEGKHNLKAVPSPLPFKREKVQSINIFLPLPRQLHEAGQSVCGPEPARYSSTLGESVITTFWVLAFTVTASRTFTIIANACRDVRASTCRSSQTTLHHKCLFALLPASSMVAQPAVSAGPTPGIHQYVTPMRVKSGGNGAATGCKVLEIPEETRPPAASSGTIPIRKNPGVTRQGIEPGSPWLEASRSDRSTTAVPRKQSTVVLSVGVFSNYVCRRWLLISDRDFIPPISAVRNELHLVLQSISELEWCNSFLPRS